MAANITPYQESSYYYIGDRTFLAALQFLLRREMHDIIHNGESMVSTKYLSMMYVADKIQQYLNRLVSVVGAEDRRLDHLCKEVDKFVDEVVIPRQFFWGHFLNREVNDLITARNNERRVAQIIKESERADRKVPAAAAAAADKEESSEDEVCELVKRPRRPVVEIENLEDDDDDDGDENSDSDCSVLEDPFIHKTDKGTEIKEHQVEYNETDGTTTTTTTTLTIGNKAVKKALAQLLKDDEAPPAPKKARRGGSQTQTPPPSPEATPLKARTTMPATTSNKKN